MATPAKRAVKDGVLKRDTRGHVRVDKERREAILAEFDRSSMSAAAFARMHGIKYTTFNYWVRARKKAKRGGAPRLALVEVAPAGDELPAGGCLGILLPNGARLEVRDEASAHLAAALLRAL